MNLLRTVDAPDQDDALSRLRAFIGEGGYDPGDRLPPERELIVTLDLSRNALRKALDTLEREGAIWRHVGKGTFISSQGSALSSLAELSKQVSPVQLMRARLSLEPAIAREAAMNASAEAVARVVSARDRALNAEGLRL